MSEAENNTTKAGSKFTERELALLGWAMQSLKSGPPEVDYDKLAAFASMSNPKSAANAWAKIKNKLVDPAVEGTASATATPKKTGGRGKKATAAKGADDDDNDGAVAPTPKSGKRKTPSKAKKGAAEEGEGGEEEGGSPKKRGRKAKVEPKAEAGEDEGMGGEVKGEDEGEGGAEEEGMEV
ncbi:hypothetical protein LTS18_005373 [Coniosporium uncinatum]|uniref:Uncharacterized protein n=1 Tax=Coniosporium uncinatum TaxID=93489 RepID=A0ACC3D4R9_9PEZI|nr:hypothetical protein LTS18_005373 [Coniosporium uncinatum]